MMLKRPQGRSATRTKTQKNRLALENETNENRNCLLHTIFQQAARGWKLCRKIHSAPCVSRLGEVRDFSVTRGEINQTVYRQYITHDPKMSRLLQGVQIGPY